VPCRPPRYAVTEAKGVARGAAGLALAARPASATAGSVPTAPAAGLPPCPPARRGQRRPPRHGGGGHAGDGTPGTRHPRPSLLVGRGRRPWPAATGHDISQGDAPAADPAFLARRLRRVRNHTYV